MVKKVVAEVGVKREKGFLYFIDKSGDVCRAPMKFGGKMGKPETVAKVGIKRVKGFLYFIDKNGDICCSDMNRKGGKKKTPAEKIKPTVKYVVYRNGNDLRGKKILLAGAVRDISVGKPCVEKGVFGVRLSYDAKSGNFYKKSSKFVCLAKPASDVRVVNKIPKKYA
jgi:hypothetical protein